MTCTWREDREGDWDTQCGNRFAFIAGGPSVNKIKICCYCGQPITEIGFDEDAEESE